MTRYVRTSTLAGGVVAAGALLLGLAPAASAGIAGQHYDLKANVDCAARTVELKGENHATEVEYTLNTLTFDATSSTSVNATSNDTAKFGGTAPLRVLTEDETQAPPKTVLGAEAEYTNCGSTLPQVTFKRSGTATVPTGGRAAAYANVSGNQTQVDTTTASGRNVGIVTNGHSDRRWGFTAAGNYALPITASVTFSGGVVRSSTDTLRFAVS